MCLKYACLHFYYIFLILVKEFASILKVSHPFPLLMSSVAHIADLLCNGNSVSLLTPVAVNTPFIEILRPASVV